MPRPPDARLVAILNPSAAVGRRRRFRHLPRDWYYSRRMRATRDNLQDLSSAYGDQDDTLSWPMLALVIVYALTVGWLVALVGFVWMRLHLWWQLHALR